MLMKLVELVESSYRSLPKCGKHLDSILMSERSIYIAGESGSVFPPFFCWYYLCLFVRSFLVSSVAFVHDVVFGSHG